MFEAPLSKYLSGRVGFTGNHLLYSVSRGDTVFYAGKSLFPVTRLQQHLIEPSTLGMLVMCNFPQSMDWQTRICTIEDCEQDVYYDLFDAPGYGGYYDEAEAKRAWRSYHRMALIDLGACDPERFTRRDAEAYLQALNRAEEVLINKFGTTSNKVMNYKQVPYPLSVKNPSFFLQMYPSAQAARATLNNYLGTDLTPLHRSKRYNMSSSL